MTARTDTSADANGVDSAGKGKRTPWRYLRVLAIGVAMGSADVIPGVSGGTMAFILGIYDELLTSIRAFDGRWLGLMLRFRIREAWRHVNGAFLLSLLLGIGIAVVSLSRLIVWLFDHQARFLFAFFFGLIVASILSIGRRVRWNLALAGVAGAGALSAYAVVRLTPLQMPHDPGTVFVCAALAIMAMILPGISGAFLLVVFGQYRHLLDALNRLDVLALLPAGAGMVVGLLSFSRVLHWLLRTHRAPTVAFLTGFLVGSLWKIWPFRDVVESLVVDGRTVPIREALRFPVSDGLAFWGAVGVGLVGYFLFHWIERLAGESEAAAIREEQVSVG